MELVQNTILVHSKIVDKGPAAVKLWYLCRAMDLNGAGKATLHIQDILRILGVSKTTLWRYYSDSSLFKQVIRRGELLTLYYRGIIPLCIDLGISHWGTTTEIRLEDLPNAKKLITLAEILSLQKKSRYLANKKASEQAAKKQKNKKNIQFTAAITDKKIDSIFNISDSKLESISEISTGIMKLEGATLLCNEKWRSFGGSQFSVADNLGRSVRTISRRLSDFPRVKVAVTNPTIAHEFNYHKFHDREDWGNFSSQYFLLNGKVFKRQPSLYKPSLMLTRKRRRLNDLQSKYDAALKATLSSQHQESLPKQPIIINIYNIDLGIDIVIDQKNQVVTNLMKNNIVSAGGG